MHFRVKVEMMAAGCVRWRSPPLARALQLPSDMVGGVYCPEGKVAMGHCVQHTVCLVWKGGSGWGLVVLVSGS